MHAEPIDPRSDNSAPVVLVYPYGIVVDRTAAASSTKAAALCTRPGSGLRASIHFETPGSIAYAILDSRLFEIDGYRARDPIGGAAASSRHDRGTAGLAGIDPARPAATVAAYNRRATGDPAHSMRRGATGWRRRPRSIRRNPTGRAPSPSRPFSPIPWSAPSPTRSAGSPPTTGRRCSARTVRCRALCRRGDHRAFLRNRAQRGFGFACAGVRAHRRVGGDFVFREHVVAFFQPLRAWPGCNT